MVEVLVEDPGHGGHIEIDSIDATVQLVNLCKKNGIVFKDILLKD